MPKTRASIRASQRMLRSGKLTRPIDQPTVGKDVPKTAMGGLKASMEAPQGDLDPDQQSGLRRDLDIAMKPIQDVCKVVGPSYSQNPDRPIDEYGTMSEVHSEVRARLKGLIARLRREGDSQEPARDDLEREIRTLKQQNNSLLVEVREMETMLKCACCLEEQVNVVLVGCGHLFCRSCIRRIERANGGDCSTLFSSQNPLQRCPRCRKEYRTWARNGRVSKAKVYW